MASTRQLTRRIKSVSNIAKITKAMETVSASKMRQAQLQALSSRQYSRKLDEILSQIAEFINPSQHALLSSQNPQAVEGMLIISTDRGLTGSLNTNLFRSISQFQQQHHAQVFTIGRLAKDFSIKSGFELMAEFGEVKDKIVYETVIPIAKLLISRFIEGKYSKVWLGYMDFVTTLNQVPKIIQLLPLKKSLGPVAIEADSTIPKEYLFEPSPESILESVLPYFVEISIYQSLLEARASEHSARMVAMKNASDNAFDLSSLLNLEFNRSRQTQITSELSDIVTATLTLGVN